MVIPQNTKKKKGPEALQINNGFAGASNISKKAGSKSAAFAGKSILKLGNNYNVKITALSSENFGLNEFTYGFPILIGGLKECNANLGDVVQIQILKIKKNYGQTTTPTYAIAKVVKVVTKNTKLTTETSLSSNLGKVVEVTVAKKGPKGTYIASGFALNSKSNFKLLVSALGQELTLGQKVSVKVTRIKENYGLAKVVTNLATQNLSTAKSTKAASSFIEGTQFSLMIQKNTKNYFRKNYNMLVMQINSAGEQTNQAPQGTKKMPTILFLKPIQKVSQSGANSVDKVKVQIIKSFQSKNATILIGKIIEMNPISAATKKAMVQASIQKMLNSGMHFGEKAIQCNARMKNYVWTRKNVAKYNLSAEPKAFSRSASSINKPFIQKGRNIINLFKTRRCLNKALAQLTKYAAKGKTFLFVGTKKAASGLIARASLFSKKAFFVNTRWLGGMLTNWKTILKSISKIRPILKEKQVIIKDILQKRQNIQNVLMEKAFLLKNKSQFVLKKGRLLFKKLQASGAFSATNNFAKKLILKRKEFVQKGQVLLEKRQLLLQKRKQVISQSQALYNKAITIINSAISPLVAKATMLRKKLRELKALLLVSQQLQAVQQTAKSQNKDIYSVSYNQYKTYASSANSASILPNPPKEILNKMVLFIKSAGQNYSAEGRKGLNSAVGSKKDSNLATKGENVLVLTKLLSQFSSFAPAIQQSIKLLLTNLQKIQTKLVSLQETLKAIVAKMQAFIQIKTTIVAQLRQIQQSLVSQRNIIRVVKRKFKQILAQKRFIQFLPKLRYLPTPASQIAETVHVLIKKIVDPKLKYPIDSIYDQKLSTQSKKVAAMRKKKWQRLEKYLGGISNMTQINSKQIRNNVAIIIGQQEEMNAVRECQKLGIKMFHVVDTNCNPGFADHFIPANDDSRNSIQFILTQFLTRIRLAQKLKKTVNKVQKVKRFKTGQVIKK